MQLLRAARRWRLGPSVLRDARALFSLLGGLRLHDNRDVRNAADGALDGG